MAKMQGIPREAWEFLKNKGEPEPIEPPPDEPAAEAPADEPEPEVDGADAPPAEDPVAKAQAEADAKATELKRATEAAEAAEEADATAKRALAEALRTAADAAEEAAAPKVAAIKVATDALDAAKKDAVEKERAYAAAVAAVLDAKKAAKDAGAADVDKDAGVIEAVAKEALAKTAHEAAMTEVTKQTDAVDAATKAAKTLTDAAAEAVKKAAAAEDALPDATQPEEPPKVDPEKAEANRKATLEYLRPRSMTLIKALAVITVIAALLSVADSLDDGIRAQVGPWSLTMALAFWTLLTLLLHIIGNTRNLAAAPSPTEGAADTPAATPDEPKPKLAKRAVETVRRAIRTDGVRPGLYDFIIGKDGRLSTSQTQAFAWTFLLAGAFVYFVARTLVDPSAGSTIDKLGENFDSLDPTYLLLLGGPFAAAVAAGLITQAKVDDAHLQKVEADQTRLRDVLTNDDGSGDLVDAQFFVFNLVAMVWFVVAIMGEPDVLPKLPPALVGLTSLSALTYTAAKAAASNAPAISAVTLANPQPGGTDDIRPGDLVEIRGINFMPPGSDSVSAIKRLRVRFGTMTVLPEPPPQTSDPDTSVETVYGTYPSDTLLVARVPASITPAPIPVSVLTGADVESAQTMVVVGADKPVITSIEPTLLHRGQSVIVRGRFFSRAGVRRTAGGVPTVWFGDVPVKGLRWSNDGLGVVAKVPMGSKVGKDVELSVQAAGAVGKSDVLKVNVVN